MLRASLLPVPDGPAFLRSAPEPQREAHEQAGGTLTMPRIIRMLVAATAAGGLALMGLMAAGTAAATSGPGTTGPGSWSFDPGTGQNAIQLGGTSTKYRAQVQPPINADGSSVFNHKSATIPLQFT